MLLLLHEVIVSLLNLMLLEVGQTGLLLLMLLPVTALGLPVAALGLPVAALGL